MADHAAPAPASSRRPGAGLTGSAAVVLIWAAGLFGVEISAEVAASIVALAAGGAEYLRKR